MARYIDADKLLNNLPDDLPYKASVKRVLIQAPTEDVVPKSEVAREIFEEIETSCRTLKVWGICGYLMSDITRLKKKYTEGNNNEV